MRILFIHGANLNILGRRGSVYGDFTYDTLKETLKAACESRGLESYFFVSNHEGEIIERLQNADYDALIINPGAYSHYSLAIADALECVTAPKIEVHITNIHARGRHKSVTGGSVIGVICGFKQAGYLMAIDYLSGQIEGRTNVNKPGR